LPPMFTYYLFNNFIESMIAIIALILCFVLFSKFGALKRQMAALEARLAAGLSNDGSPSRATATGELAQETEARGSSNLMGAEEAHALHGGLNRNLPAEKSAFAMSTSERDSRHEEHVVHKELSETLRPEQTPSREPDAWDNFVAWLKEDWILKLGAFLVLIAFGWLASYAFIHNWIGPMGRITLGLMLGAGIMVFGFLRMRQFVHQGAVFLVVGSTTVILTIFAARSIYEFFTPVSALAVMFVTSALVAWVSVLYQRRPLAIASLLLASIAPMLVNSLEVFAISQFTYLFVVVLGTIWVVAVTRWRVLNTLALAIVTLYSLPNMLASGFAEDIYVFLFIAFAFAALFFVSNVAGIIRNPDRQDAADITTALWNGLLLLGWIMVAAPEEWQSLIIVACMLVFLVASYLISVHTHRPRAFLAYAGVGVVMLATATAIELEGAVLTIAFSVEAAVLTGITYLILRDARLAEKASYTFALPVLLSVPSFLASSWSSPNIIHEDFFVLLILGLILITLGSFFADRVRDDTKGDKENSFASSLLVAGSVYLLALVWLVSHAILPSDIATLLSLAVYTVLGISLYFRGVSEEKKGLTHYGGILLGLVVARLIFVDVWQLELTGRIVTFFVIGALLMGTAFFGKKRRVDTQQNLEDGKN